HRSRRGSRTGWSSSPEGGSSWSSSRPTMGDSPRLKSSGTDGPPNGGPKSTSSSAPRGSIDGRERTDNENTSRPRRRPGRSTRAEHEGPSRGLRRPPQRTPPSPAGGQGPSSLDPSPLPTDRGGHSSPRVRVRSRDRTDPASLRDRPLQ